MTKKQPGRHHGHTRAALALLCIALATTSLAIYQWVELRVVQSGGHVVCSINTEVNCETVWTSPFAVAVHNTLGVPVAALGVLWGAVAVVCALWLFLLARAGMPVRDLMGACRLTALAGLLSIPALILGSIGAGAVCLTCLLTYLLVAAFFGVAFFGFPRPFAPQGGEWWTTLGLPAAAAMVAYVLVLIPSSRQPPSALAQATGKPGGLEAYLANETPAERQALADNLALYQLEAVPGPLPPERNRQGEATAPVKVVEWTDIRCPHCKRFNEMVEGLRAILPPGSLAVEARNFPLDSRCNPLIPQAGDGVACDGALALICLEKSPDFWKLRDKLFEAQRTFTARDKILEVATSTFTVSRPVLEACMAAPETMQRLQEDIRYAQLYHPTGTPTVTVNGRLAPASDSFLYVLAMTAGNPAAPSLAALPPPSRRR
jgi:protein-disulfide isomerase